MLPSTWARARTKSSFFSALTAQRARAVGANADVANAKLLEVDNVLLAPATAVVAVGHWGFSKERLEMKDGGRRKVLVGIALQIRRGHPKNETILEPDDAPLQAELDLLPGLASHDRIDLRELQVDDLARRHLPLLEPVLNLRHQGSHRLL